jgi:tRNA threonylcarbamoyladenosine biosynthesis protein TsaE
MELKFSLGTIHEIATRFWNLTSDAKVFAFHGEMGSGKTTFIHALCEAKGVTEPVTSPTFSIINEYGYSDHGIDKKIFHLDLYRLKDAEEAARAGIEDCLYSGNICLVEWPDRSPGIFPSETTHIYLTIIDSTHRKLRIDDKIS